MTDFAAIRSQFPILDQEIHGHPLVYLDSAATSQKPQCVIDAESDFYRTINAGVHRGAHELAARSTMAFEDARAKVCYFAAERLYNNFSSLEYALSKYPDDTESEKTVYQINGIQTPGMFNARTVIKIKRNPILPKSLAIEAQKTNGSCNEPDVIKQLKDDSNDKCYIQENIRRWKKRIEQQEIQELMESLYI